MGRSKAEDAGGLSPVKDNNDAAAHFNRRTLPFLDCVNYKKAGQKTLGEKLRFSSFFYGVVFFQDTANEKPGSIGVPVPSKEGTACGIFYHRPSLLERGGLACLTPRRPGPRSDGR